MRKADVIRRLSRIILLIALSAVLRITATLHQRVTSLPRIEVHRDGHMLQTEDGRPFFWLGDTAWELIDHTTKEEASYYLHTRALQGFTMIQTVVLAEMDGVNHPSALGQKPFINGDPTRPNDLYFDHVKEIADEAAGDGLCVALVPIGATSSRPLGALVRVYFGSTTLTRRAHSQNILLANCAMTRMLFGSWAAIVRRGSLV